MGKSEKKSVTKTLKKLMQEIKERPEAMEDLNRYVKSCLIPEDPKDSKNVGIVKQKSQALFKYYNNKSKKNPANPYIDYLRTAIAWSGYRGFNPVTKKLTALLAIPMIIEIGAISQLPPAIDKNEAVDIIGRSLSLPDVKDEAADDDSNKVGILTTGSLVSPQHNMIQKPGEASRIISQPNNYPMRPIGVHYRFLPVMFELPANIQTPGFRDKPVELENCITRTLTDLNYKPKVVKVLNVIELFDVWNLYDILMKQFKEQALAKQYEKMKNQKNDKASIPEDDNEPTGEVSTTDDTHEE